MTNQIPPYTLSTPPVSLIFVSQPEINTTLIFFLVYSPAFNGFSTSVSTPEKIN